MEKGGTVETEILKLASSQGIWAALSIVLIFYILKAQEKRDQLQAEREEKYQQLIASLTDRLEIVEEIRKDISQIKNNFRR